MLILFLILIVLALVILIANIAIVPQAYSYVVERLGVYYTTWEAGFHFKTPFVTRIAKKVSLKEQVCLLYTSVGVVCRNVRLYLRVRKRAEHHFCGCGEAQLPSLCGNAHACVCLLYTSGKERTKVKNGGIVDEKGIAACAPVRLSLIQISSS